MRLPRRGRQRTDPAVHRYLRQFQPARCYGFESRNPTQSNTVPSEAFVPHLARSGRVRMRRLATRFVRANVCVDNALREFGETGLPRLMSRVRIPSAAPFSIEAACPGPESRQRIGNLDLDPGDEDFVAQAFPDVFVRSRFEVQLEGFDQVGSRFFDRRALTGNVELRTQGNVEILIPLDNCRDGWGAPHEAHST